MTVKYQATIKYDTKENHPDEKNAKGFTYTDTYTIDTVMFNGDNTVQNYIKRDMALVAGGGYDTDTIENVKIDIQAVN